jgi:hypothetical protein
VQSLAAGVLGHLLEATAQHQLDAVPAQGFLDDRGRVRVLAVEDVIGVVEERDLASEALEGLGERSKTVSLVRNPASARPSIEGSTARAPVAITAFLKRSLAPATSMASRDTKRPSPRNTSTPISCW